jgi:NB-ARC domain/Tetratricopeptide repeat
VAIALVGLDKLPPGPPRDFFEALHVLYDQAGQPGARVISGDIRRDHLLRETVSHETVSAVLRGTALPGWAKVHSIVVVLLAQGVGQQDQEREVARIHRLWLRARSSLAATPPAPPQPVPNARPEPTPPVTPAVSATASSASTPSSPAPSSPAGASAASAVLPPEPDPPVLPTGTAAVGRAARTDSVGDDVERRPVMRGPTMPPPLAPPRHPSPDSQIVGPLPERNPSFVGREHLLGRMRSALEAHPHSPLVLYGVGGVGKTQLAREYLHKFEHHYEVIWWVPADRPERARASLVSLADRLRVANQATAEQTAFGVLARLEWQQLTYVLVFDGAEEAEIRRLMPNAGGHVIVTSRDPAWAHESSNTAVEVTDFDSAEAIQFLRQRDHQMSGAKAEELTQAFGRLPLALDQLSALQLATGHSWDEIRDQLNGGAAGLFTESVSATLRLALERLRSANPEAALVFELFAWFSPEPVSIALLRGGRSADVSFLLGRALQNPVRLHKSIGDICRFGLARLHADSQRIEVQPVSRLALRDVLTEEARNRAQQHVHVILAEADPGWPDELPTWEMHREMAAHVLPAGLVGSREEKGQQTVLNQIRYRNLIGEFEDASHLGQAAVTAWRDESFLGPDHELVLLATREWATSLRAVGRYLRSRQLTADATQRLRANSDYGDDHEQTLAMASSLADDLRFAGEYAEALATDEQTYRRCLAKWGESDPRTVASRHGLSVSLRLVGEFTRAMAADTRELDRHRTLHGERHVATLRWVNALAEDLYGLGRYRDVIELHQQLRERGGRLAPARDTLLADRTLALARRGLGELRDAFEALRDHYHGCIESFGDEHELTLSATMSYANALRQRNPDEAHVHATDAVSAYLRTFGRGNPLTLAAEVNLAAILRTQGERNRALKADTAARDALRATLGDRHPYVIAATANLASDHALADDKAGALHLSELAYATATEVRGATHPDTLAIAANLTIDRWAGGEASQAEELLKDVLTTLRRTLGQTHPIVHDVASGNRLEIDIEPPPST